MPKPELRIVSEAPTSDVVALYQDAGWWQDDWSESAIPAMIRQSFRFAGLFLGAKLVGMGRALSDGVSDAYIQDIVVRGDLRGHGYGAAIVRLLVRELQAAGIDWIGLVSVPGAEAFYEKLGFRVMTNHTPMKLEILN